MDFRIAFQLECCEGAKGLLFLPCLFSSAFFKLLSSIQPAPLMSCFRSSLLSLCFCFLFFPSSLFCHPSLCSNQTIPLSFVCWLLAASFFYSYSLCYTPSLQSSQSGRAPLILQMYFLIPSFSFKSYMVIDLTFTKRLATKEGHFFCGFEGCFHKPLLFLWSRRNCKRASMDEGFVPC